MKIPIWIFLILLSALFSVADDLSAPLSARTITEKFESAEAEALRSVNQLESNYLIHLQKLFTAKKKAGKPTSVQEIKSQIELISAGIYTELKLTDKDLIEAEQKYQNAKKNLLAQAAPKRFRLLQIYSKQLKDLSREMVKSGKLDEALKINKFAEKIDEHASQQKELIAASNQKKTAVSKTKLPRRIKIKVLVDGLSFFFVRDSHIWFDHRQGTYAKPGLHGGSFPTYVNGGTEWTPEWDDKVTKPFKADMFLPSDEIDLKVRVRNHSGRGYAEVVEQPSEDNNYTAKVKMSDSSENGKKGYFGSEWLVFSLSW